MEDSPKPDSSHWKWWLIGGAMALSLVVAVVAWFVGPKVWTDGQYIRVADRDTKVREVIWTPPQPLEGFASDDQVYEPSISPDGTELYFVRGKAGGNAKIYVSRRQNNAWTKPISVDAVNGSFDSLGPRISPDGNFLYFYSNRPGGLGGYDIWASPRTSNGWGKPFDLGPNVNSEFNEFNPDPTPDGRRLIFATNRKAARREQNEAWRSTIRETVSSDYDLWIADAAPSAPATQPSSLVYARAHEIPGINTNFTEGASCMSPPGDFLYFSSNRPGGLGKFDIWRARVRDGNFLPPENLAKPINSGENEADPALAYNGFRMIFSSDRPGADGRYHLMVSDSREVYPEHQARPLPALGWSWWLLIASLLVLIPLLLMMRGWEDNRFSLIQKCLLLSLLVHALITFILSFVAVTQKVTQYVRREMELEVAVNLGDSRGVEETLAVRGQVSGDLPVSAPPMPALQAVKTVSEPLQAITSPLALDAPASQIVPGSMTIPLDVPRPGVPAPTEVKAPAPQAAIDNAPQVKIALPESERVAQNESAPKLSAIQTAVSKSAAATDIGANTSLANVQVPSSPMKAVRSSNLQLDAPSIKVSSSSASAAPSAPQPNAGAAAEGPLIATDGHLPPIARASAAERQLISAASFGPPTTRPTAQYAIAQTGDSAGTIKLASKPLAAPSAGSDIALVAIPTNTSHVPATTVASAIQPRIDGPPGREVDPPNPNIATAKVLTPQHSDNPEGPVTTGALASSKPMAEGSRASSSVGSTGVSLANAKPLQSSSAGGGLVSAAPTRITPQQPSQGPWQSASAAANTSSIAAPQIVGPKLIASAKAPDAGVAVDKALSTGGAVGSTAPAKARNEVGSTHAIDISPAPILAASKVPSGGRNGPGIGGTPTARMEIAAPQIRPELSVSNLTGPLGPTQSLIPDLTVIRAPEQRKPMLEQFGGTKESEDAVMRALAWLASVQEDDGRWTRIDDDESRRRRIRGQHDMACTSLALLAFLGHDETPDRPGPYKDAVSKAVDYLISQQDEDGDLRGPRQLRAGGADSANMYDQGITTYALAECAIMTRDPKVIDAAIKGAKFIVASQDEQSGGWRYSPHEFGDSSVFGWQVMALHSAQQIGFEIPQETLDNAKRYIRSCGQGRSQTLAGYQPHTGPTVAMTAEILFSRMLLDIPLEEDGINEATRFLARDPPDIRRADLYYWYYASLSMLHMQNPLWKDWNILTRESLIRMQQADGGWETNIKWGERAGRVFTTSLATLTLEVYYRYLPLRRAADTNPAQTNGDERR